MEKMNIFFLIVIFTYILYSFLKSRKKPEKKEDQIFIKKSKKNEKIEYYITAVIASIMDGKEYRIKKVFIKGKEDKKSFWKISGRQENMLKTIK